MRIGKARGAGESIHVGGVLSPIVGEDINYPAQIAPIGTLTYTQSLNAGIALAAEYDRDGPWIGVGFSFGCCVLVEAAARGKIPNCRGLVLLANPLRCGAPTYGIAGQVPVRIPHVDLWIHDDPITSLPSWDGSRAIAAAMTGRPQAPSVGWLNAGAVVASLWRYAVTGRHIAYGSERPAGERRTYVEIARDTAYRMAGRS